MRFTSHPSIIALFVFFFVIIKSKPCLMEREQYTAKTTLAPSGRVYKINHPMKFEIGGNRLAFEATITEGPDKGQAGIVKIYKKKIWRGGIQQIKGEINVQRIARQYAIQFSQALKDEHLLEVLQLQLVKIQEVYKQNQYFQVGSYATVQLRIPFQWKQWTTWKGKYIEVEESQVLSAFEHFVYEKSDKKRMICDLQGGEDNGKYLLTDPTLSTFDGNPKCNGGQVAIDYVMSRHRCNSMCKNLKLKEHY